MGLTTVALSNIADAIIGGTSFTKFDGTNAYVGVGNSNTAFNAAQTDLQGASKKRNLVEATYPQRTTVAVTFSAVFAPADANFQWLEWGIFNAAAAGQMLNRSVSFNSTPGTKTNTETWRLVATDTFVLV